MKRPDIGFRLAFLCAPLLFWQGCESNSAPAPKQIARQAATDGSGNAVDRRRGEPGAQNGSGSAAVNGPRVDPAFQYSLAAVDTWVGEHKVAKGADAQYYGYVHLPVEFANDQQSANLARIAVFKALNHTSRTADIYTGEDISDGRGLAYAIDTRRVWPERGPAKWDLIQRPLNQPSGGGGGLLESLIGFAQQRDNSVRVKEEIISVNNMDLANTEPGKSMDAARFVYNALYPNVYNYLIDTPGSASQLVRREGVSRDLRALSAHKEAIVNGPRVSAYYLTNDGRYYISTGDYFANFEGEEVPFVEGDPVPDIGGNSLIPQLPGGTSIVSESYVQAKNGCLQYFIWGAGTQERGRAELVFVEDPQNHSRNMPRYLTTGRSCINCHVNGAQAAPSVMPSYIESGRIAADQVERAKAAWTSNADLNLIYQKVSADFRDKCMGPIVNQVSNGTPEWNASVLSGVTKEPTLFMIRRIEPERQRRNDND